MISSLLDWARAEDYIFIRFTHSEPEVLSQLATAGHAEDIDACPYLLDYPITSNDYIVEQFESDAATLATFDREVRRKLRRATEAGYEFLSDDSPESLARAWPLYQHCAGRKHFRLERPLSVYMESMRPGSCPQLCSSLQRALERQTRRQHPGLSRPLPRRSSARSLRRGPSTLSRFPPLALHARHVSLGRPPL